MTNILNLQGPAARRHAATLTGSGQRLVLLAHGLGSDQDVWSRLRPQLDLQHRVLSYDLAGAGRFSRGAFDPKRYARLSGHADDLLDLLDEVGVRRCCFVGHSVAGMVGALASIEAPDRFERLVLINASPRYLDDAAYLGGLSEQDLERLMASMRENFEAWVRGLAPDVLGDASAANLETFVSSFLAMPPDLAAAMVRATLESDLRPLLPHIAIPVVLIHSRRDPFVPPAVSDYLLSRIAGARRVWIEASGHHPHLTDPAGTFAALEEALA